jgi:hypothetical protein
MIQIHGFVKWIHVFTNLLYHSHNPKNYTFIGLVLSLNMHYDIFADGNTDESAGDQACVIVPIPDDQVTSVQGPTNLTKLS